MRRTSRPACAWMLASLTVGWLAACGDGSGVSEGPDQSNAEPNRGSSAAAPLHFSAFEAIADGGVADPDGGQGSATAAPYDAGVDYSDEELLAILLALHDTELILGRAALLATDPQIQALGADVVATHGAGRERALALGILPIPNQQAAVYLQAGVTLRAMLLGKAPGDEYDDMYLNLQIMLDALVSQQIAAMWLPMTDSPDLQAELTATREGMQADLDRAVAIRTERHPPRPSWGTDAGGAESTVQDAGIDQAPPTDTPQGEPVGTGAL